ncbi:MAG: TonB-dependent receptor [Candidatus Solibacter usitatus]|nr:TonB-dependent receptor [Candidatus Solibacter usitatus]
MFWQLNFQDRWTNNGGAGGITLPEAGVQSRFREDEFLFNHRYTIQPKLLSQFRILIARYWSPAHSNTAAARIAVNEAFTGGGAQSDRLATEFHTSITWLLTQTLRKHTFKYGINIPDWSRRGLNDKTSQIGSLAYASIADYAAAHPFSAVVQRGETKTVFVEKNVGGFFQDEWQVRGNLSLGLGVRYDWQNFLGDTNNLAPRFSFAYSPDKGKKWALRGGTGSFYDRTGPGPLWDALRFDGVRLRRFVLGPAAIPANIATFTGAGLPTSIHQFQPSPQSPYLIQFSGGLERQLARKTLLAITYTGTRGAKQFRSRDANAPLPPLFAARPNASLSALRIMETQGRLSGNSLEIAVRGTIAPKVTGMLQYTFGRTLADFGGINWYPANSFAPSGEWSRTDTDRGHQLNFLGTANPHRWVNLGISAYVFSGTPYTITTGRDDNGDGLPYDRPQGVSRNTQRNPGWIGLDLRWFKQFRLRPALKERSPSLTFSFDAFNAINRVNDQTHVGVLTSPFFGRAVATLPARRLQLGLRYQF